MNLTEQLTGGGAFQNLHSILILVLLGGLSMACLAFIVERWIYFRRIQINPEKVLLKIRNSLVAGRIDEALGILGEVEGNPLMAVIHAGVKNSRLPKEQVGELMRACGMRQRAALERNLTLLGTMGNTSPFVGLLGTVMGIIQAFHDLAGPAAQAGGGATVVATGIAEALIATAAGLVVAIPAVVAYNIFLKKVKYLLTDMEIATMEMMVLLSLKPSSEASGAGNAS